jgi:malate permease and related proteins
VGSVNHQFLINTLVILLGWLLRRFLLTERDGQVLIRVVFNVTLPALVIHTFSRARFEPSLALLTALALGFGTSMAAFSALVLYRRRPRRERGQLSMLATGFNVGLFAYPFVEGALGVDALRYLGMFDMGVAVVTFGVACGVAAHFAREGGGGVDLAHVARQLLGSVPFVVYMATLLLAVAGARTPAPLVDLAAMLSRANMPLSLLVLGIYLNLESASGRWGAITRVLGLRYLVGLAVGTLLYLTLPFDPTFRTVALVGLVLPPPLMILSYAVQYGYDHRFVGMVLNVANVVSYLLLWGIFNLVGTGG